MARQDLYATRPTRFDGERVEVGEKVTASTDEEAGALLASNRFSKEPPAKAEPAKKTEAPK